jgi:hypothetical protein
MPICVVAAATAATEFKQLRKPLQSGQTQVYRHFIGRVNKQKQ